MNRPERIQRPMGAIVVIALFALAMPLPSSHAHQPPADVVAPPARKGTVAPIPTLEEADRWAERFVAAIADGDINAAEREIDWDTLFDAATKGVDAPESFRKRFIEFAKQENTLSGLIVGVATVVGEGAKLSLLRSRHQDGQCRVLLRLISDGGINYHDVLLAKRGNDVRAVDYYTFVGGEHMTASFRRNFVILASLQPRPFLERLLGLDRDIARNVKLVQAFLAAVQKGDHVAVLSAYQDLPRSLQHEKSFMILRLSAAAQLNEQTYKQAIDDLQATFPGDPCLQLPMIDMLWLRQEYDACLAAIDRVDAEVGGDPYLDEIRGRMYLEKGDPARAASLIEAAIDAVPDRLELYWSRLTVALRQRRHGETAAWLDTIAERFPIVFNDLDELPDYAEFVKSPEYRDWKARQGL